MATVYGSNSAVYQGRRRTRTAETGIATEKEWRGTSAKIAAAFDAGALTQNATFVSSEEVNGRGRLIARWASEPEFDGSFDQRSDKIEELYGVDMVVDIRQHPQFAAGGILAITGEQMLAVDSAIERKGRGWSATWTNAQKTLYNMIARGMDSYLDCGFILRQSIYAARTQQVRLAFGNVGRVPNNPQGQPAPPPTLSASMGNLLDALPAGEWLQRPPSAEYLGRGKWRLSREYQWSRAWHTIYGGTLDHGVAQ